ncbi:MAG: hypothetical protein R3F30_02875 [Planctomycetota bacterium]
MAEQINFIRRRQLVEPPVQAPLPPDDEPMTLRALVAAVFRWRRMLLVLGIVGALVGFVLAITKPNTYLSSGAFLVKTGGEQVQPNIFADPTKALYQPQLRSNAPKILLSGRVLRDVAERVGPEEILAPYDPPEMVVDSLLDRVKNLVFKLQSFLHADPHMPVTVDNAVEHLRENLIIETGGRDDLIEISYRANSKERAQRILATYMQVAQEVHLEVYNSPEEVEIIEENYREAGDRLKNAQLAMRVFLDSLSVQDFDLELTSNKNELRRLSVVKGTTESSVDQKKKRVGFLEAEVARQPELVDELVPEGVESAYLKSLRSQQAKYEQDLSTKLVAGYREDTSEIKQLRRRIADIEKSIEAELAKPSEDVRMVKKLVPNKRKDQLLTELNKAVSELEVDQESLVNLQRQEEELGKEIDALAAHKPHYDDLAQEVADARQAEQRAQILLDLARKKQRFAARGLSSLVLMDGASFPHDKEGPRRMVLIVGSTFGALAFGLLLITILQLTDRTVRTPDDLEAVAGIPVLAVIPRIDRKNLRRHETLRRRAGP